MDEAACRQVDPELFYPAGSTGPALLQIARAKAVCARCPVRLECLGRALDERKQWGVRGGMSEEERQKLIRALNQT